MIKKSTVYLVVAILLAAGQLFAAQVTNIELSYQENTTVARIDVDGQVRFTHQTEVPKNGKPDRLIVDILSAEHDLGSTIFSGLPLCDIQSIRTSQYSVKPEKVVRVVFDLQSAPLYRIESNDHSITVYFTDQNVPRFATWSSSAFLAEQKAKREKQEKTTVASKREIKPTTVEEKPKIATRPPDKLPTPEAKPDQPTVMAKADKPATPERPVVKATTKSSPSKTSEKAPTMSSMDQKAAQLALAGQQSEKPVQPKVESKPAPKQEKPVVAEKPKAQPKQENKPSKAVASQPSRPKTDKPATKQPSTAQAPAKKTQDSPKVASADKSSSSRKNTSRFRRTPTQPRIKGTMVAEFPKRLVIKYHARSRRDPFETLINESKTYNNPVEQKLANVEGLRLVGIIEADGGSNRALFEDNDGYGYILKSGDKVKNGYVLRVEADRVFFQIFEYGWSRTVALRIEK